MIPQRRIWTMLVLGLTLIAISLSSAAILRADSRQVPMQSHDFTDVPVAGKAWMEEYINAFYHQGITGGCSSSPLMYCPEATVTRAEMAVFIGRALGYVTAENSGLPTKAYFNNTNGGYGLVGKSSFYSGVLGINAGTGNGVYGHSEAGIGVNGVGMVGVSGYSQNGFAMKSQSPKHTALYVRGGYNVTGGENSSDTTFDIQLGGPLGEVFGETLFLFSNGNVWLDLDDNNDNSNTIFAIRSGSNNGVFVVDEDGSVYITDLHVTGVKNNIVDTMSYGTRAMYAVEATESWFEDFGAGQLVDGVAVIEIDPIYAQTVNLSEHYHVYLTPIGDAADLYIEQKTPTSFTVRSADPTANLSFDYRIVAKRLGYEDVRMEEVATPPTFND